MISLGPYVTGSDEAETTKGGTTETMTARSPRTAPVTAAGAKWYRGSRSPQPPVSGAPVGTASASNAEGRGERSSPAAAADAARQRRSSARRQEAATAMQMVPKAQPAIR